MAWTVLPVVILAAIGTFVFYKLPGITDVPEASAADQTRSRSRAHQFYWLFRYPNGAIAIDDMRAPAGTVVHERRHRPRRRRDPQLVGAAARRQVRRDPGQRQRDVVPGAGRPVRVPLRRAVRHPARVHERLRDGAAAAAVRAMGRAARAELTGADLGKEEWEGVCQKCHRLDEELHRAGARRQPAAHRPQGLETLLREASGNMPAVGNTWTDAQIDALVAYTRHFARRRGPSGDQG